MGMCASHYVRPPSQAQRLETESISNMHLMLRRSIEMTEFLHIVGENKFIGVFSLLPQLLQVSPPQITCSCSAIEVVYVCTYMRYASTTACLRFGLRMRRTGFRG
jgi:hypothetical protein